MTSSDYKHCLMPVIPPNDLVSSYKLGFPEISNNYLRLLATEAHIKRGGDRFQINPTHLTREKCIRMISRGCNMRHFQCLFASAESRRGNINNLSVLYKNGYNMLNVQTVAALNGNEDVIMWTLEVGMDLDRSALLLAEKNGHFSILEKFKDECSFVSRELLFGAIIGNRAGTVDWMRQNGMMIPFQDDTIISRSHMTAYLLGPGYHAKNGNSMIN